jgi:hypothetical protein
MTDAPQTIPELIGRWKTIADFANAVGCGYEAARQMRRRESIAPEHWQSVISASETAGIEGVTYEWLAKQRRSASEAA